MRATIATIAVALVGALVATATASASIYRGTARDDAQMPVKLTLRGEAVTFAYSDVITRCSDDSEVRQGGAKHNTVLNERGRFNDTFEVDGATSLVRGSVQGRKATGIVSFDLVYDGGECHSDKVEWKAKRKQPAALPGS